MCGIAGFFRPDAARLSKVETSGFLEHAVKMLSHRGPDETSLEARKIPGAAVGLAQARLAVIDLTRGLYPISSEDG